MNLERADRELLKELLRSAEVHLAAQLTIATSADQRAAMMASVFAAAGAALMAGVISVAAGANYALIVGGGIAASLFLIGASCCARAAMPTYFWLPGNEPRDWAMDINAGHKPEQTYQDQVRNLQRKITENHDIIEDNADWFERGARFGIAAPLIGLVVGLLTLALAFTR